jgi:hypothetical protein
LYSRGARWVERALLWEAPLLRWDDACEWLVLRRLLLWARASADHEKKHINTVIVIVPIEIGFIVCSLRFECSDSFWSKNRPILILFRVGDQSTSYRFVARPNLHSPQRVERQRTDLTGARI